MLWGSVYHLMPVFRLLMVQTFRKLVSQCRYKYIVGLSCCVVNVILNDQYAAA